MLLLKLYIPAPFLKIIMYVQTRKCHNSETVLLLAFLQMERENRKKQAFTFNQIPLCCFKPTDYVFLDQQVC